MQHCNNCVFIGIWHCFHPNGDYGKKKSFSDDEGKDCRLWRQGEVRPKIDDMMGYCSKCGKDVPILELKNSGKGLSYCKECV